MSRYAAVFADPQGPGDARPTATQIVTDNDMQGKLAGKFALITGVSSGLGVETARALVPTGVFMFLTARNFDKAKEALGDDFDARQMQLVHMDQASFDSVREGAKAILAKTDKISIFISNAAVMALPERKMTKDGHELQWQTNHLSHFLLFNLLKDALLNGATPDFPSRVVAVSASAHRIQGINAAHNYNWDDGSYQPWTAYAQSKTANIYMANEIERRYGTRGLHASSLHPGIILTGLGQYLDAETVRAISEIPYVQRSLKDIGQGAATTLWATLDREWEGNGGKYLVDCAVAEKGLDDGQSTSPTDASHTYSPENEARLWKDSLALVGLTEA